ncbi:hypothetical protein [Thiolinea disciformis]|uniref:hypothetical protein n=1 Tax=Thiolinea disciformis TaxID=125614 RepID=UPI00036E6817|nr:hypothetical protein [Thiolinea disciformis]
MSGIFNYEIPRTRGYAPNHRDLADRPRHRPIDDHRYGCNDFFCGPFGGAHRYLPPMYKDWLRCIRNGDCEPRVTTQALGEEDGGLPPRPPMATTFAVGEEDGGFHPTPIWSTRAHGEEESSSLPPSRHIGTLAAFGEN